MAIYDITDSEIKGRDADVVDMNTLSAGDKIGCWGNTMIAVDSLLIDFLQKHTQDTEMPVPVERILMCFVASIQPHQKFKVYFDWGDTTSILQCANLGRKLRSEPFARQIFPMLDEYQFTT